MIPLISLLTLSGAQATAIRRDSSSILNSSYVSPQFEQSCDNIWSYAVESFEYLLNGTDFPDGWVGQNGWTNVAQWDYQQHSRGFYDHYNRNETYYAYNPTGCYAYWHAPLTDCYNDDAGWAALSSLQGYESYGDPQYLTWAEDVFDVCLQAWTLLISVRIGTWIHSRVGPRGRILGRHQVAKHHAAVHM